MVTLMHQKLFQKHSHNQNIDEYIFLGDYFGDFPYPNEVVDALKEIANKYIISGNKESYLVNLHSTNEFWVHNQFNALYWNYNELNTNNLDYLLQQ